MRLLSVCHYACSVPSVSSSSRRELDLPAGCLLFDLKGVAPLWKSEMAGQRR